MKMTLYIAATLITIASLISCAGNSDKDYVDKTIIPPGGTQSTAAEMVVPTNTTAQNTTVMPANTMPANTTVIPGTNTPVNVAPQMSKLNISPQNNNVVTTTPQTITQATAPTNTAPGMNPPHGQPGHRCDISVGAPLNSKPAAPAATTINTQPQQPAVTMKEVPNTVKTAPGMNPPHGEPNHRCDIAVGAPLNSKPAATMAPPALLTPGKSDSSKH